jgi:CRP-like cAMP-binding protein
LGTANRKLIHVSAINARNTHPLIRKLETVFPLSDEERKAILALPIDQRVIEAHQDIVREGDRPSRSFVIADGVACAFKMTGEGKRQILAFHITGDMPDLQSLHLQTLDISIGTITACKVGFIQHEDLQRLCERQARVAAALWRETLIYAAMFREWITNIGRRQALGRAAHFMCEYIVRARAMGLVEDYSCELPITQEELSDAMGLSIVHVNRVLQELRKLGLINLESRHLTVLDWTRLQEVGDFDAGYLHLPKTAT